MKIKKILVPLLLIILLASTIAFGSNIPLGPYFDDAYFDISDSALILKVIPHEKGGLETDVSAYDGLLKISGGSTSAVKLKLDATSAPTVNNDVSEGYIVGSRWVDVTNDKEYVCLDNTDGAAVWTETTGAAGGYTNLTEFVDQTAWRVFYSNTDGDVIELALGGAGTYLKSTGATSAPIFDTPTGAGDMLKATYDNDEDGEIDVAGGGTEKDSWTQYAIPYLSNTTVFGEILIGTAGQVLKVSAGATGYEWATLSYMANLSEDPTPELGGQLQAGAHSINFTEQVLTSGTAIAWDLGNSNKATLTAAHNFTITITAPSGALNAQLIVTQDGTGSRLMDEIITQIDTTIATDDVHADTEIIDLTVDIPTGARIRFKTTGVDLPEPLVVDTIYWAIRSSENHIQVATTKALAILGTAVDIEDQGSGQHTVHQLVKWIAGTKGVLSTTAGAEDVLSLTYKTADKQWYAQLAKDFY